MYHMYVLRSTLTIIKYLRHVLNRLYKSIGVQKNYSYKVTQHTQYLQLKSMSAMVNILTYKTANIVSLSEFDSFGQAGQINLKWIIKLSP